MSKQDPAEQVKFLISCIGNTANGRPDFQEVANNLGIVSKAAAQKRYERLLKSYNITTKGGVASMNDTTDDKSSSPSTPTKAVAATPTKRKARAAPAGSAKKRGKPTPTKKESDDEDVKPAKVKQDKVKDESDTGSTSSLTDAPPSDTEDAKSETS